MRLLEKNRNDRYATADAALEAMDIAILELDYTLAPARGGNIAIRPRIDPGEPVLATAVARTGPTQLAMRTQAARAQLTLLGQRAVAALSDDKRPLTQRPALLLGLGALAITAPVATVTALRPEDSVASLTPDAPAESDSAGANRWTWPKWPTSQASREELDEARAAGPAALVALSEKYPLDHSVVQALMVAHARAPGGLPAALGAAKKLLEMSPEAASEEELRRVVRRGAEGPHDASPLAFELMRERMGSHGPDLLYEMASGDTKLRDRAAAVLREPAVVEKSTPALRIASELRAAKACKDKKPLLSRASEVGDERSVAILAPLIVAGGKGCGFFGMGTCPAKCGAIANEIKATIAAIDKRTAR
jgi:hypothetical protein